VARRAEADHRHAVQFMRRRHPAWEAPVIATSARTGDGIAEVWAAVGRHRDTLAADGSLERLRSEQAVAALWSELEAALLARLRADPAVAIVVERVEAEVRAGTTSPARGAAEALAAWAGV